MKMPYDNVMDQAQADAYYSDRLAHPENYLPGQPFDPQEMAPLWEFPQFDWSIYDREIWEHSLAALRFSENYDWYAFVVPDAPNASVIARGTFDGRISVLPGTLLYGMSGSSDQPEGFKVQIQDLGSKALLFPTPVDSQDCTGGSGSVLGISNQLSLFRKPFFVVEPGLLSVKVQNLSPNNNSLQLVIWAASPRWARERGIK